MLRDEVPASSKGKNQSPQGAAARQELEMQEWAKSLRVAPARLKQAVAAVGITPRRIREYLRKNP
jgi:hypothetical protein